MGAIETLIIYGAVTGAIYALLALGFTLIYGVANVVNMAHGVLFMLGAYMFYAFGPAGFLLKLEPFPALVLAVILVGIMGIIVYLLTIHPIIEDELAVLVATVGAAFIIYQIIYIIPQFGGDHHAVPPLLPGVAIIWGVRVTYSRLMAFTVSLGLFVVVSLFIAKSKIGGAMRAVAQDREVAMLMGVNTTRLYMITMAISSSLAAIAGILIAGATTGVAEPHMWLHPLILSFAIVILGGLGSIKGSLIGAFIVGYAENAVTLLIPEGAFLKGAVAMGIMVAVLLIKPKGLFGKRIELE